MAILTHPRIYTKSKKYNSADRVKSQYLMSFEYPHVPT